MGGKDRAGRGRVERGVSCEEMKDGKERKENVLFKNVRKLSDIHHRPDMQRELHQNGEQHVKVEDIAQRPFPRQFLHGLPNTQNPVNIELRPPKSMRKEVWRRNAPSPSRYTRSKRS